MTAAAKRRKAWRLGWSAETICVIWLQFQGYRIIARRQRTPVGEIDVVARRGRVLAIVEVKVRADRTKALESVSRRQRKRLERAAQWLLAGRTDLAHLNIRYDVMAIAPWRMPTYISDAWRTDDI